MAKSNKQIEEEVLSFLDNIGVSAKDYQEYLNVTSINALEKMLILHSANFVIKVQENLQRLGKVDTGALSSEITQGDVIKTSDGYSVEVGYPKGSKAEKYYDYVNKGVKGFQSGNPADSPYSFKDIRNKKGGVLIGRAFQKSILGWYRRNASAGRKETQTEGLSKVQKKRAKLLKTVNESKRLQSLAYATAVKIKQKGLRKTGFFDKAVQSTFGKDFYSTLAKITGKSIGVAININKYGNNNK